MKQNNRIYCPQSSVFLPILFSLSLSLSPPFAAVAHLGCCCCSSISVRQNGGRPKFEAVNTRRIIKWAEKTRVSEIISFFHMNDFNDYPRILWRVINVYILQSSANICYILVHHLSQICLIQNLLHKTYSVFFIAGVKDSLL